MEIILVAVALAVIIGPTWWLAERAVAREHIPLADVSRLGSPSDDAPPAPVRRAA